MAEQTIVWFEDEPTKGRLVVRYCLQCQTDSDFHIVSPRGTAHYAAEHYEGRTRCGIDATRPEWWWRT